MSVELSPRLEIRRPPESSAPAPVAEEQINAALRTRPWKIFIGLLVGCTAVRLLMAGQLPLSGDEAYYWLWSQHPAFGYYDRPMVAWVIWGFTHLFGESATAARAGAVLSLFCIPLILSRLTEEAGGGKEAAAATGFLCLAAPYLVVESAFITPNSPFLLFWSVALWWFHRILVGGRRSWLDWIGAGATIGLACLGKLMALLMLPALLLFLLVSPRHRPLLTTPQPYVSVGVTALVFSPYLWWNAIHHWEDFRYQLLLRHLLPDAKYSGLAHFLMLQAATISPVLLVVCLMAVYRGFRHGDASRLYLSVVASTTLLFFALCSVGGQVELYWTLGGYLAAFVNVSLWLLSPQDGVLRDAAWLKRTWVAAAVLIPGLVVTGLVYVGSFCPRVALTMASLHPPPGFRGNGVTELYSYLSLADDTRRDVASVPGPVFVVTDSYALSSVLSFYTQQYVHTMPGNLQGQEWRRWEREEDLIGQNALYLDRQPLTERPDVAAQLRASFSNVGPERCRRYSRDGLLTGVYWEVPCRGFRGHWVPRVQ